jgi:hypothetical protein
LINRCSHTVTPTQYTAVATSGGAKRYLSEMSTHCDAAAPGCCIAGTAAMMMTNDGIVTPAINITTNRWYASSTY